MSNFEIHSNNDPKSWLKVWDSKIVEYTSKNRGVYGSQRCFFGTHKDNKLMVFLHEGNSTTYLATRFEGSIEADPAGSKISGTIARTKSATFFLWFMFVAMSIGGIVMAMDHQLQQALLLFALAILGLAVALYKPKATIARIEKLLTDISETVFCEEPKESEEEKGNV